MINVPAKLIEIEEFKAWVFDIKPPRMESAYAFNIMNYSQKMIFKMMGITHKHGFSCSAPMFGDKEHENEVVFSIGCVLPSKKSLNKYSKRMYECLKDIAKFDKELKRQNDFSVVDLSMFTDLDLEYFDPQIFSSIRDETYNGSWDLFYDDMIKNENNASAQIIVKCVQFEEVNDKDIALVGNQLDQALSIVEEILSKKNDKT